MNVSIYTEEVQNWIKEVHRNRGKAPDIIIANCNKIEKYGRKTGDDALIGFACFSRGEAYYLLNETQNFYEQMIACLVPMENIGEWGYLAMANNMLGIMSLNRGNAPFAMDYYRKALEYCNTYKLPDLEWIVHMNMGSLYLNIEEYQKALNHFEVGYQYISQNMNRENAYQNLMVVYLGIAKAYLNMGLYDSAEKFCIKLQRECVQEMSQFDVMVVDCFRAKYTFECGDKDEFRKIVNKIDIDRIRLLPIMDVFDDLYEYLKTLLVAGEYQRFQTVYAVVSEMAKHTGIKNLEKKLLTLEISYFKKTNQIEDFKNATIIYYELTEEMEKENRLLITSMIGMRKSLDSLAAINREFEQKNLTLQRQSETDSLTGLWNRLKLNSYGEAAFERAISQHSILGIEILDIDYFKQYNDNYGHQAGDEAIKFVAGEMQKLESHGNVSCFRYGGDEFVIIYEGFNADETRSLAEELKDWVNKKAIPHEYSLAAKHLTISQGVYLGVPKAGERLADYLHKADDMLYEVKKVSRNSIRVSQ